MAERWKPKARHKKILKHLLKHPAAAVWARMGAGKTSSTLAAIDVMREKAGWRALVVAPKSVALDVWESEIEKWSNFSHLKIVVLHGRNKLKLLREKADIYVINYDGLPWLARSMQAGTWKWKQPEILVLDESTKVRNTDTQRFKILRDVFAPNAKRRYALSGKPQPNGMMNLFGQYRLIDGGERLGRYITHFRNQFCYQTGYGGYTWEVLPGAEDEIVERVKDITIEVSRADMKDMPDTVIQDVPVSLDPRLEPKYQGLEREFVLRLKEGEVTAVNSLVLTGKLRQFLSGAIYTEHPAWEEIHDARLSALDAALEETGNTLLVYNYEHESERILKEFPGAVNYTKAPDKLRKQLKAEWNAGEIELMLVHPKSAAHGLNLQEGGCDIIMFGLDPDLELYDQVIARLARPGQKADRVFVHRFRTFGTVDDATAAALERKGKSQENFLLALREHYL